MQQFTGVHRDDHARLAGVRQDESGIFVGELGGIFGAYSLVDVIPFNSLANIVV